MGRDDFVQAIGVLSCPACAFCDTEGLGSMCDDHERAVAAFDALTDRARELEAAEVPAEDLWHAKCRERMNILTAERDRWKEEARRYAENADHWHNRLNEDEELVATLRSRLAAAESAVEAVRAEHLPWYSDPDDPDGGPFCATCANDDEPELKAAYPCPTVRALPAPSPERGEVG